jgi:hypothetical protein
LDPSNGFHSFAKQILDCIDHDVYQLEGTVLSKRVLEEIREGQTDPWPEEIGYVNYVTDSRCESYLPFYVGQTVQSWRRILVEHAQAIMQCDVSTLHYFILWVGNGNRQSNFIRLWTIPSN